MSESGYGVEERLLLESGASQIYAEIVTHGSLSADDARLGGDSADGHALSLLIDIGLLRLDDTSSAYLPMDPSAIQAQIVVPLGQRGTELLTESARWAEAFTNLGQSYRTSKPVASSALTEIQGFDNINSFIQAAVNDCRTELLTAQPYGRRPATALAVAEERDLKALERGVRMRTLYQHSARHSPTLREYVADIVERGAEVRTLDEFFKRLIIVDRQVAIIPGSEDHASAVAVHDKSMIDYLIDIFERSWERARTFHVGGDNDEREIASDVRAMTIRLLLEGHSDPASAKRLGVSTRTYAGYIAALKDEYGVQTRFQLGHAMGRGDSRADHDPLGGTDHDAPVFKAY